MRKTKYEGVISLILSATLIEEMIRKVLTLFGINISILSAIDVLIYLIAGTYFFISYGFSFHSGLKMKNDYCHFFVLEMILLLSFACAKSYSREIQPNFASQFRYLVLFEGMFFLVGISEIDYETLIKKLSPTICFSIIYSIAYLATGYSDRMVMSYNILPWTIVSIILQQLTGKKIYTISTIVLILLILVVGSRMPLLCISIFYLAKTLFLKKKMTKKMIFAYISVATICVAVFLLWKYFIVALSILFPDARTIQLLASGEIMDDSNRSRIYEYFINRISESPYRLRGLYADRIEFASQVGTVNTGLWVLEETKYTHYPHNIFLEIIYDYGIIIGGLACILIVWYVIRDLMYAWQSNNQMFALFTLLIVCVGFVPLLVTNSFLQYSMFWLFLGYSVTIKKKRIRVLSPNGVDS